MKLGQYVVVTEGDNTLAGDLGAYDDKDEACKVANDRVRSGYNRTFVLLAVVQYAARTVVDCEILEEP